MATIKIAVKKRVIERLKKNQRAIRYSIDSNRRGINSLSEENAKLKRELAELEDLIRVTNI